MSEVVEGDQLEAEAHALEDVYNDAKPSYAAELEWFGMSLDHDTKEQQFVMEVPKYVDTDGLAALREAGWEIQYIEANEDPIDEEIVVSVNLPVRGEVPDVGGDDA